MFLTICCNNTCLQKPLFNNLDLVNNLDFYIQKPGKLLYWVPIEFLISFSITLFVMSVFGLLFNKQKNIIVFMLFVELMLFSLSLLVIGFSILWASSFGQIAALLILTVAVSESAIGLGILIASYRLDQRIEFADFAYLKG